MLNVCDDSGFLAIVVTKTYSSYVARDWELNQLFHHFRRGMDEQSLLIWGTGCEGIWRVDVRLNKPSCRGFREICGPLSVKGGQVLLTSYESLTMAAQFDDVRLPEKHQTAQVVKIPDGQYACRIIQCFDPEKEDAAKDLLADFVVEITQSNTPPRPWDKIPWYDG